jgi:iron-sulfur cluster assembly protein
MRDPSPPRRSNGRCRREGVPGALFLLGTVMDFEEDILKSGFTFNNPNQTGESVQLKPADLKALAEARAGA